MLPRRQAGCLREPPEEQAGRRRNREKARAAEPERPELSFLGILKEEEPGFVQRAGHFPVAGTPFPGENEASVSP